MLGEKQRLLCVLFVCSGLCSFVSVWISDFSGLCGCGRDVPGGRDPWDEPDEGAEATADVELTRVIWPFDLDPCCPVVVSVAHAGEVNLVYQGGVYNQKIDGYWWRGSNVSVSVENLQLGGGGGGRVIHANAWFIDCVGVVGVTYVQVLFFSNYGNVQICNEREMNENGTCFPGCAWDIFVSVCLIHSLQSVLFCVNLGLLCYYLS